VDNKKRVDFCPQDAGKRSNSGKILGLIFILLAEIFFFNCFLMQWKNFYDHDPK